MIISASRRTDIAAFYAEWFTNRLRAGYCTVPNPYNRKQVAYVSLKPEDVEAVIFWTRNPRPLMSYLDLFDRHPLNYYFQYTVMDNPRQIDTKGPALETSLATFKQLSERLGDPRRVVWRYDPIVLSNISEVDFHLEAYQRIAHSLKGFTKRSVISIVDPYAKARGRLQKLRQQNVDIQQDAEQHPDFARLMHSLVRIAAENGMDIQSCAETIDLTRYDIQPGKCIDGGYLKLLFDIEVTSKKDPTQREACGCVQSKDIGMYDTCLFGCQYCYATSSFETAKANHANHDPASPSIVGWYDAIPPQAFTQQLSLFSEHDNATSRPVWPSNEEPDQQEWQE